MGRFLDIFRNIRLVWRLFWDGRVPLMLKFAMPVSMSYLALPYDLLRDFGGFPAVGRLDDLIILALASIVFVRLAPQQIVQEHRKAIWGSHLSEGDQVTEGEYEILNDDQPENKADTESDGR